MGLRKLCVAAVLAVLANDAGQADPLSGAFQQVDTLAWGERRCLKGRPQDCLEQPVPADEPHGAACATCHTLWPRSVPANEVRSCTAARCHSGAAALSVFHRTVRPEALSGCVHCHKAHEFRVPRNGDECGACHKGGGSLVEWVSTPVRTLVAPYSVFTHSDHRKVDCSRCHGTQAQHGALVVISLEGCRNCHHRPPLSRNCTACHAPDSVGNVVVQVTKSLDIRIGSLDRPLRVIDFEHSHHIAVGCSECHTQGSDLRAAVGADCSGCHLKHHQPTSNCSLCHKPPAKGAHTERAHLGCSGEGCHSPVPDAIRMAPRTRELCLACHTDEKDHRPGRVCVDCHVLPEPTGVGK